VSFLLFLSLVGTTSDRRAKIFAVARGPVDSSQVDLSSVLAFPSEVGLRESFVSLLLRVCPHFFSIVDGKKGFPPFPKPQKQRRCVREWGRFSGAVVLHFETMLSLLLWSVSSHSPTNFGFFHMWTFAMSLGFSAPPLLAEK